MTVFLASLPCYLFLFWRTSSAAGLLVPNAARTVLWLMLGVGAWYAIFPVLCYWAYYTRPPGLVDRLMNGYPTTDFLFAYPFWVIAAFAGQIFVYVLAVDGIALLGRSFQAVDPSLMSLYHARATVLLVVFGLGLSIVTAYLDTRTIRVRERVVPILDLPADLEGFRLVQVSDVQADPRTDPGLLQRYTDKVNSLGADVVLFAGDLVTRGTAHVQAGVDCIGRMRATHGVYACLGDHDIWSAPSTVTDGLHSVGVKLVEDGSDLLEVGDTTIGITVITNAYSGRPDHSFYTTRTLGDVSILLSHQPSPDVVESAAGLGYDLMFSGHTRWTGCHELVRIPGECLSVRDTLCFRLLCHRPDAT